MDKVDGGRVYEVGLRKIDILYCSRWNKKVIKLPVYCG